MAVTFPTNPTNGQTYTYSNVVYTWDGKRWVRYSNATLPALTGNSGRYLTTDGTVVSWGTVAAAVPKITSISVTDNSYTVLDDTAVSTTGGYIKITGTGFTAGSQVLIGTVAASSVSFVGSTELRAQVPATAAGTYVVYVVATDGAVAIRVNGITFSATPTWSTGSSLGSYGTAISIQLAAVSDTAITYSLAAGSTLPTGLTLSSSGLLSGTVTGVTVDTTYNFTINAVDLENQDSPRTFSITITIKDAYFPYVPLLLETAASSTRSTVVTDSSTNAFTVTRSGTPSTGWTSPYQTDGYWGNYFGGTSDYLSLTGNVAFNFGTNDFTVECWAYFNDLSDYRTLIGNYTTPIATGNGQWLFQHITTTNKMGFYYDNGTGVITGTTTLTTGVWYHFAMVRSGSTITAYVNGISQGTATFSGAVGSSSATLNIGAPQNLSTARMNGYISNVRVVKGVAVYTGTFTPPVVPLATTQSAETNIAAITGTATSLLTCQSNRFRDNSTNNSAITVSGTPQVTGYWYPSTFTAPAASPGAGYFNGTTDYLTIPNNSAFELGAGNFSYEAFVYATVSAYGFGQGLVSYGISGSTGTSTCDMQINSTGYLQLAYATGASATLTDTALLPLYQWSHCVVCRSGTTLSLYVNGIRKATATTAATVGTGGTMTIGGQWYAAAANRELQNGYLSSVRILKGASAYDATLTTLTVPTAPLTAIANTSLLTNLADSNYTSATNAVQNNTFIDSGPYAWPITRNGTPTQGSVTPYWPDGYWGNYFSGSGNYLTAGAVANWQFLNSGASNYTIEAWVFVSSVASQQFICSTNSAGVAVGINFQINSSANVILEFTRGVGGSFATFTSTGTVTANAWNHIAVTFATSGKTASFYINGVAAGSSSNTGFSYSASNPTNTLNIARDPGGTGPLTGYISNLRITNTLVYSGAFTPSTTPLTAISGTALLTCQSNRFRDNSTNNFVITTSGTPQVQAFQPFSPTAPYAAATYGGSGYFNGSTDILTVASNAAFGFGTGDFTVEFWIYPLVTANSWSIYHGTATNAFIINTTTSGQVTARSYGVADLLTTTATLAVNAWTHLAVTRSGTTLTIWLNGVSSGTVTNSTNFATTGLYIGRADSVTAYLNGYMSNLRVVKGTAAYTAAFTPPSAPVTAIANTSLLINFTNAGIYDASTQNNAITVGDAQASTTQYKWSPTSMKFDGTGDCLNIASNQGLNLGTGSLTIEAWVYLSAMSGDYFIISSTGSGGGFFGFRSGTDIGYGRTGITWDYQIASGMVVNTWYHVALSRNGTSMRIFVNGSQVGTTQTTSQSYDFTTTSTAIGSAGATLYLNGYIQDLRITKGLARYTVNFSVPTLAFQTR
jgi:hypothetical protein